MSNPYHPNEFYRNKNPPDLSKTRRLHWFIRTYLPPDQLVLRFKNVAHYAYITHDKDIKTDGSPDVLHHHIVISFYNQRYYGGVCRVLDEFANELGRDFNYNVLPISTDGNNSLAKCFVYLTHGDDPDKYQYDLSDVRTDNIGHWNKILASSSDLATSIEGNKRFLLDLIEQDKITLMLLYGRDYIRNFNSYNSFVDVLVKSHYGDISVLIENIKNKEL